MATGNPRNKVCLPRGRSLMDWVRLTNSGANLSGVADNERPLSVTADELSSHCQHDDVWIALRGSVYNVTNYLDFHPGGVEELMQAAGKDATGLFDSVHRWVNFQGMLKACYIGKFVEESMTSVPDKKSRSFLVPVFPASGRYTGLRKSTSVSNQSLSAAPSTARISVEGKVPVDSTRSESVSVVQWSICRQFVRLDLSVVADQVSAAPPFYVCVLLLDCGERLQVLLYLGNCVHFLHWRLSTVVTCATSHTSPHPDCSRTFQWQVECSSPTDRDLLFKLNMRLLESYDDDDGDVMVVTQQPGIILSQHNVSFPRHTFIPSDCGVCGQPEFMLCRLIVREPAAAGVEEGLGTWLLTLRLPPGCRLSAPLGCHVLVSLSDTDPSSDTSQLSPRPYTVVTRRLNCVYSADRSDHVYLLVKACTGGSVSPVLTTLPLGAGVRVSVPFGSERRIPTAKEAADGCRFLLLAAGSGFTPMIRLMQLALIPSRKEQLPPTCSASGERGGLVVNLSTFNRHRADIIWKDQLDQMVNSCSPKLKVTHVLSANGSEGFGASEEELGGAHIKWRSGCVSRELVAEMLSDLGISFSGDCGDEDDDGHLIVAVCGPVGFMTSCRNIITSLHIPDKVCMMFDG